MRIRAGFEISYHAVDETPMSLLLSVHPDRRQDLLTPDVLEVEPAASVHQHVDLFGNLVTRVIAPGGPITFRSDFIIADSGLPEPHDWNARQHAVKELPDDVLPFLLGSRYCETDRMGDLAWALFGQTEAGWPRLQAILDYAHQRIQFGYEHARKTRTAFEAHEEGIGVCRDYSHLAITLCRCMNIPARYCTGYLGDIGVPAVDAPMDFSAWLEVYLGGRWHSVDARHNQRRIGRIVLARGRDATDVAISTAFGSQLLTSFSVVTEALDETASASGEARAEGAPPAQEDGRTLAAE
ncbi:transglutaminase family protein [Phenylobacterium sp. LjRoot225]|uniref:transglutaminase-like domain-containing protein n=1 Tax=Phenylobacterium sp. LjRoot225 TaxID=3342285 RepID=UPI003ECCF5B5